MDENAPLKAPTITLTSGPVTVYPSVQQALSRPIPYDYDPYFQALYERVRALLGAKKDILLRAAEVLKVRETLEGEELHRLLAGDPVPARA